MGQIRETILKTLIDRLDTKLQQEKEKNNFVSANVEIQKQENLKSEEKKSEESISNMEIKTETEILKNNFRDGFYNKLQQEREKNNFVSANFEIQTQENLKSEEKKSEESISNMEIKTEN